MNSTNSEDWGEAVGNIPELLLNLGCKPATEHITQSTCAHGTHRPRESNLKLKKPNLELKKLTPELMFFVTQINPL